MPVFQYTARTLKGDLVNDKIDLPSRDDVIAHLRKNRMVVVQVRAAPKEFKLNLKFGGGVKTRDVVVFTRQFATMINAGLPLVQALDILAQQTENKVLADTTRQVVYDVESGQTLTEYWWLILGVIAGSLFALNSYYKTAPGRLQIDTLLLKTPVLGDVLRKAAVSRFTRTLGTLISSGVSILDGLEITARTAGNMVIHNAVMESRASIAGGETIAAPLAKSKVFPPMVGSLQRRRARRAAAPHRAAPGRGREHDARPPAAHHGRGARSAPRGAAVPHHLPRGRSEAHRVLPARARRHLPSVRRPPALSDAELPTSLRRAAPRRHAPAPRRSVPGRPGRGARHLQPGGRRSARRRGLSSLLDRPRTRRLDARLPGGSHALTGRRGSAHGLRPVRLVPAGGRSPGGVERGEPADGRAPAAHARYCERVFRSLRPHAIRALARRHGPGCDRPLREPVGGSGGRARAREGARRRGGYRADHPRPAGMGGRTAAAGADRSAAGSLESRLHLPDRPAPGCVGAVDHAGGARAAYIHGRDCGAAREPCPGAAAGGWPDTADLPERPGQDHRPAARMRSDPA